MNWNPFLFASAGQRAFTEADSFAPAPAAAPEPSEEAKRQRRIIEQSDAQVAAWRREDQLRARGELLDLPVAPIAAGLLAATMTESESFIVKGLVGLMSGLVVDQMINAQASNISPSRSDYRADRPLTSEEFARYAYEQATQGVPTAAERIAQAQAAEAQALRAAFQAQQAQIQAALRAREAQARASRERIGPQARVDWPSGGKVSKTPIAPRYRQSDLQLKA